MEISNVVKAPLAHTSNAIVSLVHPVARGEDVIRLRLSLRPDDHSPGHFFRNPGSGDRNQGRGEIEETNQVFARRAWLDLARPADDQWDVNALVVDPSLAARHPASVIAEEKHDRVVGHPRAVERFEDVADLVINSRRQLVILPEIVTSLRRVG